MAPKPLPVPRVKKVEKEKLDVNKTAEDIISKNIFILDVAPAAEIQSAAGENAVLNKRKKNVPFYNNS